MKNTLESYRMMKSRARSIVRLLHKEYPSPAIALEYATPFQLLVAVILSAQCTDARVNMVTPALFRKYRSPGDFAAAGQPELEEEIRSTGFYRSKARNIIACATSLVERHDGEVPRTMEELTALAGVGRKTANCVLGGAYGIPEGIVVDTHVKRQARRLGLSAETDPGKIERDLMELIPQKEWIFLGSALLLHGRRVCESRNPACERCVLNRLCPSAQQPSRG